MEQLIFTLENPIIGCTTYRLIANSAKQNMCQQFMHFDTGDFIVQFNFSTDQMVALAEAILDWDRKVNGNRQKSTTEVE